MITWFVVDAGEVVVETAMVSDVETYCKDSDPCLDFKAAVNCCSLIDMRTYHM